MRFILMQFPQILVEYLIEAVIVSFTGLYCYYMLKLGVNNALALINVLCFNFV